MNAAAGIFLAAQGKAALQTALVWTDADVEEVLAASVV